MPCSLTPAPIRRAAGLFSLLLFLASLPSWAQERCPSDAVLRGAWAEQGGEAQLVFEAERVVVRQKEYLRVAMILSREACRLAVRDQGVLATWTLSGDEQNPRLDRGKGSVTLDRLERIPPGLALNPITLPRLGHLPAETVKEVATELTTRAEKDQAAWRSGAEKEREAIVADNVRYLREVVSRHGWIDIPRFGKPAAAAAIGIAKHGGDLPLNLAALPVVEKDARENGGGKELVAVLVDEVLIATGHKQKYGTQIAEDENGKPYAVPVESLTKVDDYRRELGIPPWSEYLKRASQALFEGAPIRIPGPDE